MRRSSAWLLITMATISITAVVVFAASVHLKPPHDPPSYTDNGLTLTESGALSGLSGEDLMIVLTATANPTGQCCNPGEACKVPGHNPAPVQVTGAQAIPASKIKNGNVTFSVKTQAPASPIAGAPDCPNSSWVESITDMVFTNATIEVHQPQCAVPGCDTSDVTELGPIVFTVSCGLVVTTSTSGSLTPTTPCP